jgi:PAS domain S-box-containing protein
MLPRPAGVAGDLFQALVEFSSDAIALLDECGIVRFSSRSTKRLLGCAPAERQDKSALDLIRGDDLPRVSEALSRLLAEPGVPITQEFLVRHELTKDGSWRNIEAVAVNRLAEPAVGAIQAG